MQLKHLIMSIILAAAVTADSQPAGKEVKLSTTEKKTMNTFFSNFSGVFTESFTKDTLNDEAMIRFSVRHNYRNNNNLFVKSGKDYRVKIKAFHIDVTAEKFFGRKIGTHKSVEDIDYLNGWYYITEASGEVQFFSQIKSMYDNGGGIYTAEVNVYMASSGWTGDPLGSEAQWKKEQQDNIPELSAVMKATLRKVTEKGKNRYILTDYLKVK